MPFKSFLALAMLLAPMSLFAKQDYQILPVLISKTAAGGLAVYYESPCDYEFQGVVLRQVNGVSVEMGAVVKQKRFHCTGLAQHKTAVLADFDMSSYLNYYSMEADQYAKLTLMGTYEIHKVPMPEQDAFRLLTSHPHHCGHSVGLVLQPSSKGLALGHLATKSSDSQCKGGVITHEVDHLKFLRTPPLIPLTPSQQKKAVLKIKPLTKIKPRTPHSSVVLEYTRKCNEAPIGPFLRRKGEVMMLGMVVAEYSDYSCPENGVKKLRSRFHTKHLRLPKNLRLKRLKKIHRRLTITPPVELSRKDQEAKFLKSCHKPLGFVVNEQGGYSHVGLVVQSTKRFEDCHKNLGTLPFRWQRYSKTSPKLEGLRMTNINTWN